MRARIDKELALFEAWIAENPSSQLFWRLAEIYRDLQRNQEAISLLERALHFHPQHIPARLLLAELYQNRPEKALEQLREAALIVSGHADVFNRLAAFMPQAQRQLGQLAADLQSVAGLLGREGEVVAPPLPRQLQQVLSRLENLRQAATIRYS